MKDLAFVPARGALGAAMLYHGASKLRGEGPEQTGQMFESLGIRPGKTMAQLAGAAEALAGVTTLLGFATRIGALAVLATQAVAVAKVHGPKGFDVTKGGYEYNLLLCAVALGMLVAGPGEISAHEVVERRLQRRPWRLARSRDRGLLRAVYALK